MVYREQGRHDLAKHEVDRAIQLSRSVNGEHSAAITEIQRAKLLRDEGDLPAALRLITATLKTLQASTDEMNVVHAQLTRGTVLAELGRFDEAAYDVNCALQLARRHRGQYYAAHCLLALGLVHLGHRDILAALRCAEEAREIAKACEFRLIEGSATELIAGALRASGRTDDATELSRQAADIYVECGRGAAPRTVSWLPAVSWP